MYLGVRYSYSKLAMYSISIFQNVSKDCMGTNNILPPEIANRMHLISAPLKSASLKSE